MTNAYHGALHRIGFFVALHLDAVILVGTIHIRGRCIEVRTLAERIVIPNGKLPNVGLDAPVGTFARIHSRLEVVVVTRGVACLHLNLPAKRIDLGPEHHGMAVEPFVAVAGFSRILVRIALHLVADLFNVDTVLIGAVERHVVGQVVANTEVVGLRIIALVVGIVLVEVVVRDEYQTKGTRTVSHRRHQA